MTVLHILASTRADHGGTSRSVPAICEALDEQNVEVHLITAAPSNGTKDQEPILPNGTVHTHVIEESGDIQSLFRSPIAFYRKLRQTVDTFSPDIIHDHGAWLPSNVAAAWTAWRSDTPLIISPRGMLTSWSLAHRSAKKRLAWSTYQRHVMNQAACFHVTAQAEADEIRGLGFSQPAAIIPNAVDVPPSVPTTSPGGPRRALFLSRIHPKKGLPLLLEAWSRACPKDWILELVGPDENGHRSELEKQIHALDLSNSVFFNGPVSDRAKWKKYASADLFVLPSHSENFGIVVAEALAAGVPALTTTGTPWQELETHDCGWWTNPSVDALSDALRQATALSSEELQKKGSRGRTLIRKKYAWKHVAEQMIQAYTWILTGGPPPDCTRTT